VYKYRDISQPRLLSGPSSFLPSSLHPFLYSIAFATARTNIQLNLQILSRLALVTDAANARKPS
jgi:hypothetical protein